MEVSEIVSVLKGRSVAYNVFSKAFKDVPDEETDTLFKETAEYMFQMADSSNNENFKKGAEMLKEFLATDNYSEADMAPTRMDRSRDYTRLFIIGKFSVPIYESVYTSPQQLTKQDAWAEVKRLYIKNFYKLAEGDKTMEDHLALELQFMGLLSNKTTSFIEDNVFDEAETTLQTQMDFLEKHLLVWAPELCDKVTELNSALHTGFYPAYAYMLKGFLEEDAAIVKELLD
ncbi:Uncharacterized component of anaerobic dehydrogenase-like protein [Denitrovibrio acetiphilus DSM 12809]|uniref:Uncharacterized component of anaerobic dehydrogenase-like protein n=1 Tax=Denitrovibrio acetiphilus (strain DSM 12809 / NBRC 114555 / N2460) TaxID=522772 RepID=D4H523_DENA2|nr:molecular chaperone TorD family protein [Denitrovibrio acetiphilus]ADD69379.1 Uncharacterized component of anaerobic dehydrogenase-like protein [Denitrovibrio acetiphilus DSM 12809]